jgi:RimJ/RimL family protein N-acetyltransferase
VEARRPPRSPLSSNHLADTLLETITRHNRRDALAYVAARPFENAFLHGMLDGRRGAHPLEIVTLDRRRDGSVRGVASFGAQLVIAADDAAAVATFAEHARAYPSLRSWVGPKRTVDSFWSRVRSWHRAPVIVRERQPIYALWPRALATLPNVDVRPATNDETQLVAEHSARMIVGELGYDPRAQRASFIAGVRRAIEQGWWWVWIVDGELRFQCNVGVLSPLTAQIQGVWTPPERRGNGYAASALAAVSRRLLTTSPTLSLYVNDFNAAAIALYERVGFQRVGEFTTYLFP